MADRQTKQLQLVKHNREPLAPRARVSAALRAARATASTVRADRSGIDLHDGLAGISFRNPRSAGEDWLRGKDMGVSTSDVQLVWSVALALCLGVLLAWTTNRDKLHERFRRLGVTDQTSFASECYGALCRKKGYIVLHVSGNRRLYGWPRSGPRRPIKAIS